jgi:hypothetical protein
MVRWGEKCWLDSPFQLHQLLTDTLGRVSIITAVGFHLVDELYILSQAFFSLSGFPHVFCWRSFGLIFLVSFAPFRSSDVQTARGKRLDQRWNDGCKKKLPRVRIRGLDTMLNMQGQLWAMSPCF